ncbi:MAG: RNA polymerase sigma factor [Aureliella sp.]
MSSLPQTRESLLIKLRQQNGEAWQEFLSVYEDAIFQFAKRRGLQEADARDVTQDVLAAVDKRIGDWDFDPEKGRFRGWLFRVAKNIAVDKVVSQSRGVAASGDTVVAKLLSDQPDVELQETTIFWVEHRRKLMHWAARQIKPEVKESSWQAFWKTAIEGEKADKVAGELGIPVGSVYAAKFRIVAKLRSVLADIDASEVWGEELPRQ